MEYLPWVQSMHEALDVAPSEAEYFPRLHRAHDEEDCQGGRQS